MTTDYNVLLLSNPWDVSDRQLTNSEEADIGELLH